MKPSEMDADLALITDPEQLSRRLGWWQTELRLSRPSDATVDEFGRIATKHALRVAAVLRAG